VPVPSNTRIAYPEAPRGDGADELHGHRVPDPYRWLEDATSPETQAWSEAQDRLVRDFLDGLPGRDLLRRRLTHLVSPGMVTVPVLRGQRAFFLRRAGDQEHAVLVVREPGGDERVLIDPASIDPEGTTTLDAWAPSREGALLAYQLSEGGNEESSLRVMDVDTGRIVDGPIDRTRYSSVAWLPGGEALYLVRKLPTDAVPEGEEQFHRRIYLHRVGEDPASDELVFGEGRDKTEYLDVSVSRDGRWLLVSGSLGTAPRNDLYLADLEGDGELRPIQERVDVTTSGRVRDGILYLFTNRDAPRFRICVADPSDPATLQPEGWRDLIPESEAVLSGFALTEDAIVVASTEHAVSRVHVHDRRTGAVRREIELPGLGSVAGLTSRPEGGDEVWIGYTDFTTAPQVYRSTVSRDGIELWEDSPGHAAETVQVVARQVFYRSKDGTEVPMFVIHRKDVSADRARPTILYGYGGFNISQSPAYSAGILAWVERGGVFAVACLRGGSEEGEAWHRAGMREAKQNVFDDFIAAGEWLASNGWTSPAHLGIYGGSNGGLLVGAALTQRPDLFQAVVCSAPLLDMVRYEKFGLGVTWNDEYGSADRPDELQWLLSYSPYHKVVKQTDYPAVLFTVFDSDTRVDPLHARKMCAALQWATVGDRPVLIRREVKVGHGARSLTREIELAIDRNAFFATQLGLWLEDDRAGAG
jgi:prolyl oligopeptidase